MAACEDELTVTARKIEANPTYVAEVAGRVVGFYLLERLSSDEVELGFLFVDSRCIGRGYGAVLMGHAKETARLLGYSRLIVQSDPNAAGFYLSTGWVQAGTRPSASIAGRDLPVFQLDLGPGEAV